MNRVALSVIALVSLLEAVEYETTFENSNFTLSTPLDGTGNRELVNYNRFRVTEHIRHEEWFITAIGDIENNLGQDYINSVSYRAASQIRSDTPFATQTGTTNYGEGEFYAQLYRLYGGYADDMHRVSLGLQKVSMGVGRIWNPTDLFNPKNPLALEPDEVYGVFSLDYTYTPSDLSTLRVVIAEREDHSFKYAGRYKGYFEVADAALNVVYADDVRMVGYELEGELMDTGVELRSEGGWFEDRILDKSFFQGLVGADYTFENSLSLAGEWLYSSRTFEQELSHALSTGVPNNLVRSKGYFGLSAGYEFDALTYGALSSIVSSDDGSWFLSPVVTYSLEDDMTLTAGAMMYGGDKGSEFGDLRHTYYLNVKVTF
ncbi:MAG: hypothetical protein R3302_09280 [Sulfurimonadaceae bacterium]|nr:hypothetical protein [Sulfurimonadaceae bacterium]